MSLPALKLSSSVMKLGLGFRCRISESCRRFYHLTVEKIQVPCSQRTHRPFVLKRSMCTTFPGYKFPTNTIAKPYHAELRPWGMRPIHTSPSSLQANLPPVKTQNFLKRHRENLKRHRENLKSAPMPALVLGFSGLIPFVLPAAYAVATMSCSYHIAYAQMAYGATILSFLGGVRWGLTLSESDIAKPNWLNLGHSVTPSLIAWLGLLMPLQPGVVCVASGLLLAGVIDSRMKGYPPWFKSLRFYLTCVALFSLFVTPFLTDEPEKTYNWYKLVKIVKIILED